MSNEINLSPVNQAYLNKAQVSQPNSTESAQPQVEEKKDGKKLLALGATALAAIGVASVAIYKHKRTIDARLKKLIKRDKFIDSNDEISQKIVKSLRKLKQETVDSMSDGFLEDLVRNTVRQDEVSENLEFIQREFTPAEIKKVTSAQTMGGKTMLNHLLVEDYNTLEEKAEIIEYIHKYSNL